MIVFPTSGEIRDNGGNDCSPINHCGGAVFFSSLPNSKASLLSLVSGTYLREQLNNSARTPPVSLGMRWVRDGGKADSGFRELF
jgi:hypothetical protein